MERLNSRIVISAAEIIGNICTKANYDKLVTRGHLKVVQRGCRNTPAQVDYESMPERIKKLVIERIGDPDKVLTKNAIANAVVHDIEARDFFNHFMTVTGEHLPSNRITEYITNAELLTAIGNVVSSKKNKRAVIGMSNAGLWESISSNLAKLDKVLFPHSLPENPVRLREKYQVYKRDGYLSLVHKGYGNKNSERLTEPAKLWCLARWANMVDRVTSVNHLFALYNTEAQAKGWTEIESPQTLKNYLFSEGVKDLWWGYRYGELKAKEKFSMQHSTRMSSMRDSLWYSDGTKLNFYYQVDGKVETITVYEVMDSYSEVFLGYHISKSEDFEAQYRAYKMAAQFSGHRPYQLGFDNQGGHKKLENSHFLSKLAHLSIKTQPYNGKSKTIESAFGRFQAQYLKRLWYFTGQNIQAKKEESKANMEFIMANKANLPSLQEVIDTYKQCRIDWNNAPHHATGTPKLEMYMNSHNPETPVLTMIDMVDLFWMHRPEPVTVTAFGITFIEKKVKHTYLVYKNGKPDQLWLRKNVDKKVYVKFDPEDFSLIYLYEMDSTGLRFISAAEEKITVARNKQEQEDSETAYIAQVNSENKRIRTERWDEMHEILASHNMSAEDYGLNTPGVKGTGKRGKSTSIGVHQKKVSEVMELESEATAYDMF